MTTKLIALKDYRAHLPTIWKDAQMNNITYIVTVHAKPVFEVRPIVETKNLKTQNYEFVTREDLQDYKKAMCEYKKGETVSSEDFFNNLGV